MIILTNENLNTFISVYQFEGVECSKMDIGHIQDSQARNALVSEIKKLYPQDLLVCCDRELFKRLTGLKKIDGTYGCPYDIQGTSSKVFYAPPIASILYNPEFRKDALFISQKIKEYLTTGKVSLGEGVVTQVKYIYTPQEFELVLPTLYNSPMVAVDIETAGAEPLKHYANYIYSIAFSWNTHEGVAVLVEDNPKIKKLLKEFFENYTGTCIYHNSGFDIQNLVYHLFMENLIDFKNMVDGVQIMTKQFEDTKLIAYLCLNSCTGDKAKYSLKKLAHSYTGNYAQENIADVTKIPIEQLLKYNVTDTCATFWLYDKYLPKLIEENQEGIYRDLFLPTQRVLIETQLVGLRLDPDKVTELNNTLLATKDNLLSGIRQNPTVKKFTENLQQRLVDKYNSKVKTPRDWEYLSKLTGYKDKGEFNPKSPNQVGELLYQYLGFPIIDTTDSGNPSIQKDTLEKLKNYCDTEEKKTLLDSLSEYSGIAILLSTFLPNFVNSPVVDGKKVLYGNFNLGGTISGRLSSSEPNLQNLPSTGTKWAKAIKGLFIAPSDSIFVGSDFSSLEDRISALTTKDPNKLKVYTDGYDGHCLRAYTYYGDKMPDIQAKLKEVDNPKAKFYKVTHEDGSIDYEIIIEN